MSVGQRALLEPPRASKNRTGWSVLVFQKGKDYQCRLFMRRQNGGKGLYSSAESASKIRPAWPPVVAAEYLKQVNKVHFTNIDNDMKSFSASTFDPNVYGFDDFTQECADLISQNNLGLLVLYLDTLGRSKDFCGHNNKYDSMGIAIDLADTVIRKIQSAGGSIEGLTKFQKLAKECAFKLGQDSSPDFRLSSINKRKITDHFNVDAKKKLTKTERVETNFREALEEAHGMEKTLVNSYVSDCIQIYLSRLAISDKLFLPLNMAKVREIKDSMEDQFDPVLATLYVIPKDLEQYEGGRASVDTLEFEVISGQHKFQAMKELILENKIDKLVGVEKGKLPCYICKTGSASVVNHANIRNNDINNRTRQSVGTEDLLFVYHGLATKAPKDSCDARGTIKTLCVYRKTSSEDTAALLKIIDWPMTLLEKLLEVLEKFKRFKTLDAKGGYGIRANLTKRQGRSLSKADFRLLGSCSPSYFNDHYKKVIDNEWSFKDLLGNSKEHNDLLKTMSSASKLAGYEDISMLRDKYPEKFDDDSLRRFKGAEVFGKKKNEQGVMLTKYIKNVKAGNPYETPVVVNEISRVFDVIAKNLDDFDVIVYYSSKDSRDEEFMKYLIEFAGCSIKDHLSVLLVLKDGSQIFNIISYFSSWKEKADFKVAQVFFEKNTNSKTSGVHENLTFGLLFGKLFFYNDHMSSLQHGPLETELVNVVKKISCPGARVASISGEGSEVRKIHSSSVENTITDAAKVSYFAPRKEMNKFIQKFMTNVSANESAPGLLSMMVISSEASENVNNNIVDDGCGQTDHEESMYAEGIESEEVSESFNASIFENEFEQTFLNDAHELGEVNTADLAATIL